MWADGAQDLAQTSSPNLILLLITIVTVAGSVVSVYLQSRTTKKRHSSKQQAIDEAVKTSLDEYKTMIAGIWANQVEKLSEERDDFRNRWLDCERNRWGGGRHDG